MTDAEELLSARAQGAIELTRVQREQAIARYAVLRPHLENGTAWADAARQAGVAGELPRVGVGRPGPPGHAPIVADTRCPINW
ncbi:hypothetical protein MKUB_52680 [Mycobacterium kubicae]|uniref:DUF222 domain-containing protein n=1 Tax=Mycobacterium kubicae TaxID=120959 RepID=A0AAX1J745_9MYCO|nr:hypothetical protein [Mycobacterium kubicae]MCV7095381.1 hypothetical protein [Mycobacterium kubicae]QNI12801.1 hypothetical protein GAN18_17790 [Mycobacterium kubicae]QPI36310.1 hypothetical protein I2456_17490 [Mycobacterium kubicae]GFG67778.1 hypothetical protein MKUB_52680 [Mycobacterium kubicae]